MTGRAALGLAAVKALRVLSDCMDDPDRAVAFKAAVEVMGLVTSCQRHGHGFALDWVGDVEPDAVSSPLAPRADPEASLANQHPVSHWQRGPLAVRADYSQASSAGETPRHPETRTSRQIVAELLAPFPKCPRNPGLEEWADYVELCRDMGLPEQGIELIARVVHAPELPRDTDGRLDPDPVIRSALERRRAERAAAPPPTITASPPPTPQPDDRPLTTLGAPCVSPSSHSSYCRRPSSRSRIRSPSLR